MTPRCFGIAVLVGFVAQNPASPPASPAALSGVVIDVTTQKPIVGAIVRLTQVRSPGPITFASFPPPIPGELTDEQGRFIFTDLPANQSYTVSASRVGYFDGAYGVSPTAGGGSRRVALADSQWFRDARIELGKPGALTGTVTDETQEPIVGARVRLYADVFVSGIRRIASTAMTTTDDRGRYRFANIRPGRYLVAVASVQDAVPAALSDLELAGTTAAAIATAEAAGRETFVRRDPALAIDPRNRLVVTPETIAPPSSASGQARAYPTTFYPSTRDWAEATAVDLVTGDDRQGLDVQLRPVPVFRVSGRLDGPADAVGGVSVRLGIAGTETAGRGTETATALTTPDGEFTFLNVPEGTYSLIASRTVTEYSLRQPLASAGSPVQPPGQRVTSTSNTPIDSGPSGLTLTRRTTNNARHLGRQTVSVRDRDLTGLVVSMEAGVSVKGRLVSESSAPPGAFPAARVDIQPANGDPALTRPSAPLRASDASSPEFSVDGLLPGLYVFRPMAGALVKSVIWNGKDYTNSPLEVTAVADIADVVITLTDQSATMSGVLRDRTGQAAPSGAVIVFPVEREQWINFGLQPVRLRSAVGSTAGAYTLSRMPAGDYFVVAVSADQAGRWKDPTFLETASRVATRVTLGLGQTTTTDLVLQVIK